jgi:hypothetical protein
VLLLDSTAILALHSVAAQALEMATIMSPDSIYEMGTVGAEPAREPPSHRTSRTKSDFEDDAAMGRIGRPAELNVRCQLCDCVL